VSPSRFLSTTISPPAASNFSSHHLSRNVAYCRNKFYPTSAHLDYSLLKAAPAIAISSISFRRSRNRLPRATFYRIERAYSRQYFMFLADSSNKVSSLFTFTTSSGITISTTFVVTRRAALFHASEVSLRPHSSISNACLFSSFFDFELRFHLIFC
jgi:hypothetical protein